MKAIIQLSPRVAPGTGGLRNEDLFALVFSNRSTCLNKAQRAINKVHQLAIQIVIVHDNLPWYFYVTWTATMLTEMNRMDPETLGEQ